ncbi:MAG: phosphate ABC transporter permease subunit PstC, partial [Thermoplasmatota archaeon]
MGGRREHVADRALRLTATAVAAAVALVLVGLFAVLVQHSLQAFETIGPALVTGDSWDPVSNVFGAWPFIFGTLFTAGIAIVLALPVGLGVALFLVELSPRALRGPLGGLVELLAGVPSIVFGMWGVFVLAPILRKPIEPWIHAHLGSIPLFSGPPIGLGFLLAGVVLAIMILPTIASISRDALLAVPRLEREAAYALGATRWEVARTTLATARGGLVAAATLGLGRALGETMAVTLVIGNVANTNAHLLEPGQTIASALATQVNEATDPLYVSALIALALNLVVRT